MGLKTRDLLREIEREGRELCRRTITDHITVDADRCMVLDEREFTIDFTETVMRLLQREASKTHPEG